MTRRAWFRAMAVTGSLAAVTACGGSTPTDEPAGQASALAYPEPRFPSYLKPPGSIDEVMPYVRPLVRAKTGLQGSGLGILDDGDSVLLVAPITADDLILEAIRRGLEERGVTAVIKFEYEMLGQTKEQAEADRKVAQWYTSEHGYMEAAAWIQGRFADPEAAKAWFKGRRPDLYDELFPPGRQVGAQPGDTDASPADAPRAGGGERNELGDAIKAYLEQNPKARGVFWGRGGSTSLRRALRPYESKFLGLFLINNRWDVMGQLGTYPGDVWQLGEDQTMEPLVHVDRLDIQDPEGTNITADISEASAQNWARGVYQRGHLYMFPNQATGRFGYSVVDYPAFQGEWLPREPMALANGTIAGTVNHTGFYPRWEVSVKDGYIVGVKGGGIVGETLKEFLQFPNINDKVYPFHEPNHPGYWWLYEIGLGTHPKGYRHPGHLSRGYSSTERNRSGVFHWGLGVTVHHDPGSPAKSQQLLDFTAEYNVPRDHGWHTHTYFTTYRVHLRNADRWVTLTDKGRLTSLDHPEVRALASRYGDPDLLLTEDWRPNMPGVNEPGDYMTTFAVDPWKYVKGALDEVVAGTYPHFFPPAGTSTRAGAPTPGGQ